MSMKGRFVGVMFTWLVAAAGPAVAQGLTPGAIVGSYGREGNAITIRTEAATVRLEFCTPSMVRVRTSFSGRFADDEPVMVVRYVWARGGGGARGEGGPF